MSQRKMLALIIAVVVLGGVLPAVFAHDEVRTGDSLATAAVTGSDSKEIRADEPVTNTKSLRQTIEERAAKKRELLERAKRLRDEAASIAKEPKDEFKQLRERLKQSEDAFDFFKKKSVQCKSVESDECKKIRKETKISAGRFLESIAEHLFKILERAKDAVNHDRDLSDTQKASMVVSLDTKLNVVKELRAAENQARGADDIRAVAQKVKDFWVKNKDAIQEVNAHILVGKINQVLAKINENEDQFSKKLDALKTSGKDTVDLDAKIVTLQDKITLAKKLYGEAQSLLNDLNTATKNSSVMKSATDKIHTAQNEIKDAHNLVKEIQKGLHAHEALAEGLQSVQ